MALLRRRPFPLATLAVMAPLARASSASSFYFRQLKPGRDVALDDTNPTHIVAQQMQNFYYVVGGGLLIVAAVAVAVALAVALALALAVALALCVCGAVALWLS